MGNSFVAFVRNSLVAVALVSTATIASAPANALSGPMPGANLQGATSDAEQVVVVRRTYVGRGPRGNVVVGRTTAWVRPGWYRWPPGGAIAAGAALGFVAASAAVAYGTAPVAGYCWYYTDMTRTQGFWDACP
jgi:hypothetical protein